MERYGVSYATEIEEPADSHWMELVDPTTGETYAEAAETSAEDLDRIVDCAIQAFENEWRHVDGAARGQLLARWADLIEQHMDELVELDVRDTGNLLTEAQGDVRATVLWLRYYAGMADKIEGRSLPAMDDRLAYTVREPYGVVAGINAYNANTLMVGWKAGPALAAGNVMVVKASEASPTAALRMGGLAFEAGIPPGVFSVITGRGEVTGRALSEHPGIARLAFTGSPATAERISANAAKTLKPLSFELGGKNAVIAMPDVDADLFAPSLAHSNYVKSGQSCATGSRIYIHSSRYDELVERMAKIAMGLRVGPPRAPESQMGSLISHAHRDHVHAAVLRGVQEGALVVAGGEPCDGPLAAGAFFKPTVLAEMTDDNVVNRTELFGPVIGLMRYEDLDEVIARANDSEYGLTAQVWGNSVNPLQHVIAGLKAGTVWVNTYRLLSTAAPYGGFKRSGYGRENGFDAIDLYTQTKTVVWDLTSSRALPYQD